MIEIQDFLEANHLDNRLGNFSDKTWSKIKDATPEKIIDFLKQEQRSVYGKGFLWTVFPSDYHELFTNWGLEGSECYAFLRSSFGCIAYYYDGKFYSLNPIKGRNYKMTGENIDFFLNFILSFDINLSLCFCQDLHIKYRESLPYLQEDEMYTLIPALPFGGDLETSKVEVVKMMEQLDILAQMYDHKATE
jgi:hypothetical protein